MADLGDLLGSLMSGLVRARRMADEQTAVLAEYYRGTPLLEGLSVPRIRVPELTLDLPMLIEDHVAGVSGEMKDPVEIATEVKKQLEATAAKNNIKVDSAFSVAFVEAVKTQLATAKQAGAPVMKETVARSVQGAFADTLAKTNATMTPSEKEIIARDLRDKATAVGLAKEPVSPSIVANIKTADVKERSSDANVVRLKITLKEEGLEWAIHASEAGGTKRTLQPE